MFLKEIKGEFDMRYDVFLVNALADSEQAEMLVRRLKALKFKVRYDKKREHTTPTPKDYRDADNAQSIIVLWSEAACDTSSKDSDWVHAIAHHARSKDGVLVQVGLDDTTPDDPFSHDKRYMIEGLTSRKTVDGYYDLTDDLGKRDGRKDLRQWIDFKTSDKDAQAAWKKKHPTDPLSLVGKPVPKKAVIAAGAAVGAATLAASASASKAPAPTIAAAAVAASYHDDEDDSGLGFWMIAAILAGILGMLLLGYLFQSKPLAPTGVANAGPVMVAQCPAGQMPASLLNILETGEVTDDSGN
jgi:hypothetical protein